MTDRIQYGAGQSPPWPRLGDEDTPRQVTLPELARAWLDSNDRTWAEQDATERCYRNPDVTWEFIRCLFCQVKTNDDLGRVAAGPLEDFVQAYAQDYILQLERLAEQDDTFKRALSGVWFRGCNDSVTLRLRALGCLDLNSK